MTRKTTIWIATLALLGALAAFTPGESARADGESCSVYVAGLNSSKKSPAEVVVFNAGSISVTLDVVIRDDAGTRLITRVGDVDVPARSTAVVSVQEQLTRDLAKGQKGYQGTVSVELTGGSSFSRDTFIVHGTQYFGNRKKPKAAAVYRSLFLTND